MVTSSHEARHSMYPHVSQWRAQATKQGIEQGLVRARIEDILETLTTRGINVPDDDRAVVEACTDLPKLKTWLHRAFIIDDIKDLFAEQN
jgi:hypothetical protein